jgi:hypothetical protein
MMFYAFTVLGLVLLGLDVAGRLTADGRSLFVRRAVGIIAATITAFTPLLLWKTGRIEVGLGFAFFAYAYLTAFAIYLFGLLVFPHSVISRWISRLGYLTLLALASLPSFVLIVLATPAALAGFGLTRPSAPIRARPSRNVAK